jgi:hypothetical protein
VVSAVTAGMPRPLFGRIGNELDLGLAQQSHHHLGSRKPTTTRSSA